MAIGIKKMPAIKNTEKNREADIPFALPHLLPKSAA